MSRSAVSRALDRSEEGAFLCVFPSHRAGYLCSAQLRCLIIYASDALELSSISGRCCLSWLVVMWDSLGCRHLEWSSHNWRLPFVFVMNGLQDAHARLVSDLSSRIFNASANSFFMNSGLTTKLAAPLLLISQCRETQNKASLADELIALDLSNCLHDG